LKKALSQYGKLVDIIESTKDDTYVCPVCKEELIRNFGVDRQYFSHPNGKGEDCELKLKLMVKDEDKLLSQSDLTKNIIIRILMMYILNYQITYLKKGIV
jgi:hypothetical protein